MKFSVAKLVPIISVSALVTQFPMRRHRWPWWWNQRNSKIRSCSSGETKEL